jgi:hypothetical protein
MAVGLGSMDMPVPSVAEWEWHNWKFARPVRAGETIYARWTLTQKRAPVGGSPTAIVVWRVDVLNAGGALCAEGEVGASVLRNGSSVKVRVDEAAPAATAAGAPPAARRGRRRRRTPTGDGAQKPPETKAATEAPVVAPPAVAATTERASSGPRRRRRRRSPGSAQARNGDAPASSAPAEVSSAPAAAPAAVKPAKANTNTLSRVIRRLRRP